MEQGAKIERGLITDKTSVGYIIKSIDRTGIITPAIESSGQELYTVGELVNFYLYSDGTGRIICGL